MSTLRRPSGFSLIELMVTLAVLAIIAVIAAPSLQSFLDKNRVVGAAEAVYSQIQSARSEAVKQSADMVVAFTTGASWCSGIRRGAVCDCAVTAPADADACAIIADGVTPVLKVVSSAAFQGVAMNAGAPASVTFNGVRGTVPLAEVGNIVLQSGLGRQLQIEVNALGRVRLCSPAGAGAVGGYPAC